MIHWTAAKDVKVDALRWSMSYRIHIKLMNIPIVVYIFVKAQRVGVVLPHVPCGFVSVQIPRDVKTHADATTLDGLVIFDNGLTDISWQSLARVGDPGVM